MTGLAIFFARARAGKLLGPTLSQSEVDGCSAIISAMVGCPVSYVAYALATAYKETAHAMLPVEEANWLSLDARNKYFFRMYDPQGNRPKVAAVLGNTTPGDGILFHGRDFVQTTGRKNYQRAAQAVGVDLVAHPERIAELPIASQVMRQGMTQGWFTSRKLSDYLSTPLATLEHFAAARRIINGTDCADEIAGYAKEFQDYLA